MGIQLTFDFGTNKKTDKKNFNHYSEEVWEIKIVEEEQATYEYEYEHTDFEMENV